MNDEKKIKQPISLSHQTKLILGLAVLLILLMGADLFLRFYYNEDKTASQDHSNFQERLDTLEGKIQSLSSLENGTQHLYEKVTALEAQVSNIKVPTLPDQADINFLKDTLAKVETHQKAISFFFDLKNKVDRGEPYAHEWIQLRAHDGLQNLLSPLEPYKESGILTLGQLLVLFKKTIQHVAPPSDSRLEKWLSKLIIMRQHSDHAFSAIENFIIKGDIREAVRLCNDPALDAWKQEAQRYLHAHDAFDKVAHTLMGA